MAEGSKRFPMGERVRSGHLVARRPNFDAHKVDEEATRLIMTRLMQLDEKLDLIIWFVGGDDEEEDEEADG